MNNTILTILSLSASGSVLALILLALRPFLKNKVSKAFQYYIWLLVLLRLALPLSFDGSIMNQIMSQTGMAQVPVISASDDSNGVRTQVDITTQGNGQNASQETPPSGTALNGNAMPNPGLPAAPESIQFNIWKFVLDHLTSIWLLGAALYFGWFIITYLRFSQRIRRTSIRPHSKDMEVFARLRGNSRIRLACNPYIDTPMLIGFLSPCIVIPRRAFVLNGMKIELQHILRHELTHYRRHDLLYKWFAVFISSLHWFNPLMILVRREINRTCELSCDEAVIRSLNANERQNYGETLLAIASNKRLPTGIVTTTMCEGKRELKERLESIMTFKSKSVLVVVLSIVLALLLAGCSMALGTAKADNQTPDDKASGSPTATATPSPAISDEASPAATAAPSDSAISGDKASKSPAATAASGAPATSSASPDSKDGTPAQTLSNNSVLEAYNAVLQNKAEYFSTDNKKKLYLNDFLSNNEIYMTTFKATHFAVLDMDGDKVPEVVLELSVGSNPQFYEILHYMNNEVYGYLIMYRGLQGLKEDGTFLFSSGAGDTGSGKCKFEQAACTTDRIGYSQSKTGDDGNLIISYFIHNKPVTKESFDSFTNEQSGKKDAVWYEFSQKNIDSELSANP